MTCSQIENTLVCVDGFPRATVTMPTIVELSKWWQTCYSFYNISKQSVTREGGEGSFSCLPQGFSLLPLALWQQPQLLVGNLVLGQEEQRVAHAALQRCQVFFCVNWRGKRASVSPRQQRRLRFLRKICICFRNVAGNKMQIGECWSEEIFWMSRKYKTPILNFRKLMPVR